MEIPLSLGRVPFIAGLTPLDAPPLTSPPRGLAIPGLMRMGLTPGLMIGLSPGLTLIGPLTTGLAPGLTATLMTGLALI